MNPFFIIGAQRSGTTLLRLILNAHSRIAIPEEGTFLMPLLRYSKSSSGKAVPQKQIETFIEYIKKNDQFKAWKLEENNFLDQLLDESHLTIRDLIERLYVYYAKTQYKDCWGDKTPSFFRMIPELNENFPNAKFIHIIRDGRDVYLSMKKKEPSRGNVAVAALEWRHKCAKASSVGGKLSKERFLEIRYEDLLSRPNEIIQEICRFLGLQFEVEMLSFYKKSHKFIGKHHSELIYNPISSVSIFKWKKLLSEREVMIFDLFAKDVLASYGYLHESKASSTFRMRCVAYKTLLIGLPRRAWEFFYTYLCLQISAKFGLGTSASGGGQYREWRIIIVSPQGYTGLGYYDYSLCHSLALIGTDVDYVSSDKYLHMEKKRNFLIWPLYKNCSGNIPKFTKGINYLNSSFHLLFFLLKSKSKVVHFSIGELPLMDLLVMFLSRLIGKKVVFTPHDINSFKKYPLNDFFIKLQYLISNKIIVHNNSNLDKLVSRGISSEKISVIHHGGYEFFVPSDLTRKNARKYFRFNSEDNVVLFVGNIRPQKEIFLFLDAINIVKNKIPNLKVIIGGKVTHGLKKADILKYIEKSGIQGISIVKLGFIPDEEIFYYYKAADVAVLPYSEISESGVLRLAWSCGVPVICSDLREFKSIIKPGENGLLFKSGDCNDLSNKMIDFFGSFNESNGLGDHCKEFAEKNLKWAGVARSTQSLYESLLK